MTINVNLTVSPELLIAFKQIATAMTSAAASLAVIANTDLKPEPPITGVDVVKEP